MSRLGKDTVLLWGGSHRPGFHLLFSRSSCQMALERYYIPRLGGRVSNCSPVGGLTDRRREASGNSIKMMNSNWEVGSPTAKED